MMNTFSLHFLFNFFFSFFDLCIYLYYSCYLCKCLWVLLEFAIIYCLSIGCITLSTFIDVFWFDLCYLYPCSHWIIFIFVRLLMLFICFVFDNFWIFVYAQNICYTLYDYEIDWIIFVCTDYFFNVKLIQKIYTFIVICLSNNK